MSDHQLPELLRVREVAELLRVHPATVRAWITAEELPAVLCGAHHRVPLTDLELYVRSRTSGNSTWRPSGYADDLDAGDAWQGEDGADPEDTETEAARRQRYLEDDDQYDASEWSEGDLNLADDDLEDDPPTVGSPPTRWMPTLEEPLASTWVRGQLADGPVAQRALFADGWAAGFDDQAVLVGLNWIGCVGGGRKGAPTWGLPADDPTDTPHTKTGR